MVLFTICLLQMSCVSDCNEKLPRFSLRGTCSGKHDFAASLRRHAQKIKSQLQEISDVIF